MVKTNGKPVAMLRFSKEKLTAHVIRKKIIIFFLP